MIIFKNKGEIEEELIYSFGVSVKETKNPIGRFGTGLKYAIANILREGGRVKIFSGNKDFIFSVEDKIIRNKTFSFITLNGKPINFTTDLGSHWESWMAYRELYSNILDEEGGEVSNKEEDVFPEEGFTKIIVESSYFDKTYEDRFSFILNKDRNPLYLTTELEVYEGATNSVFYRGIKVYELLEGEFAYTYNLTNYTSLTEDRTLLYPCLLDSTIRDMIIKCSDRDILYTLLSKDNPDIYEHGISLDDFSNEPSLEFRAMVYELEADNNLKSLSAERLCSSTERIMARVDIVKEKDLPVGSRKKLRAANNIIKNILGKNTALEIIPVVSLGGGIKYEFCKYTYKLYIDYNFLAKKNVIENSTHSLYKIALKRFVREDPTIINKIIDSINPNLLGKNKKKERKKYGSRISA